MTDPSSYQAVGWIVVALSALVVAVNAVLKLTDRMRDKPPASEVARESAEKFVSKPEFRDHVLRNEQEHDNFFKKIGGVERGLTRELQEMERRLNSKDEERTHGLHDRVNEILGEMREIRGELNVSRQDAKTQRGI